MCSGLPSACDSPSHEDTLVHAGFMIIPSRLMEPSGIQQRIVGMVWFKAGHGPDNLSEGSDKTCHSSSLTLPNQGTKRLLLGAVYTCRKSLWSRPRGPDKPDPWLPKSSFHHISPFENIQLSPYLALSLYQLILKLMELSGQP